jgi:nicotinamidase-related amidase
MARLDEEDSVMAKRAAILAMDLQRDFLDPGGRLPIARQQIDGVITTMNAAITWAARTGVPVVYVLNAFGLLDLSNLTRNFAALQGAAGAVLDPRIVDLSRAPHVTKKIPDAFSNPELAQILQRRGVDRLVVGGVYADACVWQTCRSALKRGFAVSLLADGIGAATDQARRDAIGGLVSRGATTIRVADLGALAR